MSILFVVLCSGCVPWVCLCGCVFVIVCCTCVCGYVFVVVCCGCVSWLCAVDVSSLLCACGARRNLQLRSGGEHCRPEPAVEVGTLLSGAGG